MAERPELRRVRRAVAARVKADTEYRASLSDARRAGLSLSEIGAAAGITKMGVQKLTRPARDAGRST